MQLWFDHATLIWRCRSWAILSRQLANHNRNGQMKAPIHLASGILLLALSGSASPAAALQSGAGAMAREAHSASDVYEAANRRCSRHNGARHCRQAAAPRPGHEARGEGYG